MDIHGSKKNHFTSQSVKINMYLWDTQKAFSNFNKHGVSFEEAITIFQDKYGIEIEDVKHSNAERRIARFGTSSQGRVLTVIFTIRKLQNGKEAIRIISARHASRQERKSYSRFRD